MVVAQEPARGGSITRSRFGQGDLFTGEFLRGPIVVTDDPNIDLGSGVESDETGGPTTLYEDTALEPSPLAKSFPRQFDREPGGGFADETVRQARNIGPDWLDEVVSGGLILLLIIGLLILLRPFASAAGAVAS